MTPQAVHCWLTRFLYNKRSRFDPLWTTLIVGGVQDGKPYLGYVDYIGTAFKNDSIATGIGAGLGNPILRYFPGKYCHSDLLIIQFIKIEMLLRPRTLLSSRSRRPPS